MGHIRLGVLPQSRNWKQVIQKLRVNANPATIAAYTTKAAHEGLELAKRDSGLANIIHLFMKTLLASKHKNFTGELQRFGMKLAGNASMLDVIGEFDKAADGRLQKGQHRSDLAEMARHSAVDTLTEICLLETKSLFGNDIQQTQTFFKKHASPKQFGIVGRRFFGKFLYRFLDYHLSRELANHVGLNRTYDTIRECRDFKIALERHCLETAIIIKDFTGAWPSVAEFRGGLTAEKIRTQFVPVAFTKIQSELAKR